MREVLVSTYTRHRNPNDPLYMQDWTAGDIKNIAPEGFYTKNKYQGAKRMSIVLLIPDDIPLDFASWTEREEEQKIAGLFGWKYKRSKFWIDLSKIVSDSKLRDLFNHDLLVDPITINKSYIDLFKPVSERVNLFSYDRSGSFASGIVDVGPNGHADANTWSEFESNIAATLTGNLTGDCNEAYQDTVTLEIAGIDVDGYTLTWQISGAGRHQGKWDKNYFYHTGSSYEPIINIDQDTMKKFVIDGWQFDYDRNHSQDRGALMFSDLMDDIEQVVKNCLFRTDNANSDGATFAIHTETGNATDAIHVWNCAAFDVQTSAYNSTGFLAQWWAGVGTVFQNCNAYNYTSGFTYGEVDNCVAHSCGTAFSSIRTSESTNNASDDGTAPDTNEVDLSGIAHGDIWTDAPNGDFSLVPGSALIDQGADLSGNFTKDIAGVDRGATWDIGVWEYVEEGVGIPVFMHHYQQMMRT